jgi:predicted PurR-regulated permease PerM
MFHTPTGSTGDARAVQDRYSGNVFLLIEQIFAQNMNVINDGTEARYEEEDLANMQYQAQLDQWKKDADDLPNAGNKGQIDDKYQMNSKGIGALAGLGAGLLGIAAALFISGTLTLSIGVGLLLIAVAVAIVTAAYFIMDAVKKDSNCFDRIPGYTDYDNQAQMTQQNKIERDQQAVTRIQQWMSKIMQQYISPANDAKSQDSNMIQGAMQWLKSMVWSQGAA